jgi:hypothetical protein
MYAISGSGRYMVVSLVFPRLVATLLARNDKKIESSLHSSLAMTDYYNVNNQCIVIPSEACP